MKKIFLTLSLVLAAFVMNAQTNYYIDAVNGDDDNTGASPNNAWKTINGHSSIWNWSATDCIVNIADGEYVITSKIYLGGNVEIVGTGKDKVFLIGTADDTFGDGTLFTCPGFFDVNGGNKTVTIKDLTMKNIRLDANPSWGGFITVQPNNTLVMNTVDLLNGQLPSGAGAGIFCNGTLDLTNVTIADCIADRQGAAITLGGDCAGVFSGCVFKNNSGTTTIQAYTNASASSGICADLNFDNCFFSNNDYSAAQWGACIAVGNFDGKKLNYHINNSTFSGNTGQSSGVLFITTNTANTREIDFLVRNSTFIQNSNIPSSPLPDATVYSMNGNSSSTLTGSISFVNNTIYHAGSRAAIFFPESPVDFNFINNIILSEGNALNLELYDGIPANECSSRTIVGNVFEQIGGSCSHFWDLFHDTYKNKKVLDKLTSVKLETTLTSQGNYKAPYLKIQDGSVAIDAGILNNALVPALDVRGQAVNNNLKDAGAYEFTVDLTTGIAPLKSSSDIKAYLNRSTATVVLSEEASSATIYSINGRIIKSVENTRSIHVGDIPSGLYILKIKDLNGKISSVKVLK